MISNPSTKALAAASPAELRIIAGEAARRKRFDVSAAAEERLRAVEPGPRDGAGLADRTEDEPGECASLP